MTKRLRCWGDGDPLMADYHDNEWGIPVHHDRTLFEFLLLDNFSHGDPFGTGRPLLAHHPP